MKIYNINATRSDIGTTFTKSTVKVDDGTSVPKTETAAVIAKNSENYVAYLLDYNADRSKDVSVKVNNNSLLIYGYKVGMTISSGTVGVDYDRGIIYLHDDTVDKSLSVTYFARSSKFDVEWIDRVEAQLAWQKAQAGGTASMGNFIITQTDGSMQNGSQKFKIALTGDINCKTLTADSIVGSVNYSTTSGSAAKILYNATPASIPAEGTIFTAPGGVLNVSTGTSYLTYWPTSSIPATATALNTHVSNNNLHLPTTGTGNNFYLKYTAGAPVWVDTGIDNSISSFNAHVSNNNLHLPSFSSANSSMVLGVDSTGATIGWVSPSGGSNWYSEAIAQNSLTCGDANGTLKNSGVTMSSGIMTCASIAATSSLTVGGVAVATVSNLSSYVQTSKLDNSSSPITSLRATSILSNNLSASTGYAITLAHTLHAQKGLIVRSYGNNNLAAALGYVNDAAEFDPGCLILSNGAGDACALYTDGNGIQVSKGMMVSYSTTDGSPIYDVSTANHISTLLCSDDICITDIPLTANLTFPSSATLSMMLPMSTVNVGSNCSTADKVNTNIGPNTVTQDASNNYRFYCNNPGYYKITVSGAASYSIGQSLYFYFTKNSTLSDGYALCMTHGWFVASQLASYSMTKIVYINSGESIYMVARANAAGTMSQGTYQKSNITFTRLRG